MNEIRKIKESQEETGKKVFMVGIIPNRNEFYVSTAWDIIKSRAQKIVDQVKGEYSLQSLWQEIYYGNVHLFMAYELPWDKEAPPTDREMQNAVIAHLASESSGDNFIGYTVMRTNIGNDAFIWHALIEENYQNTTAVKIGFDWMKKQARTIGAKYMSCAVYNPVMKRLLEGNGFTEAYSVMRLELPKEEKG